MTTRWDWFDSIQGSSWRRSSDHPFPVCRISLISFVNIQGQRLPDQTRNCNVTISLAEINSYHPCDSILDSMWSRELTIHGVCMRTDSRVLKYMAWTSLCGSLGHGGWWLLVPCCWDGILLLVETIRNETQLLSSTKNKHLEMKMRSHYIQISHIHTYIRACSDGLGSVFLGDNGSGATISFSKNIIDQPPDGRQSKACLPSLMACMTCCFASTY